jgi:hypothetical protein
LRGVSAFVLRHSRETAYQHRQSQSFMARYSISHDRELEWRRGLLSAIGVDSSRTVSG